MNVRPDNNATRNFVAAHSVGGHFLESLALTGAALVDCWCKADNGNRRDIGENLLVAFYNALVTVAGWSATEAQEEMEKVRASFHRVA